MLKKSFRIVSCLLLLILAACSDDTPEVSQDLRKIGKPIQGIWQIADGVTCQPENPNNNIKITENQILLSKGNETTVLLEEMKQLESTRFIMLSGTLKVNNTENKRTLAYIDEGNKLFFKGFIINGKLLSRKNLLEKYNVDGNAKRTIDTLDFNFCSSL